MQMHIKVQYCSADNIQQNKKPKINSAYATLQCLRMRLWIILHNRCFSQWRSYFICILLTPIIMASCDATICKLSEPNENLASSIELHSHNMTATLSICLIIMIYWECGGCPHATWPVFYSFSYIHWKLKGKLVRTLFLFVLINRILKDISCHRKLCCNLWFSL